MFWKEIEEQRMFVSRSHSKCLGQTAQLWGTKMSVHEKGQVHAFSQSYLVWSNNALEQGKTVFLTKHPVLMAELSSPEKRDWICWEDDGKDQSLHHIHPVKATNIRKINIKFPAKTNLSDLGIFFFFSLNWWNSASRCLVFFQGSKSGFCKMTNLIRTKIVFKQNCKVVWKSFTFWSRS